MNSRLPVWFKQDIPGSEALKVSRWLAESGIDTVCRQARCPNINHCFSGHQATFMILGNTCTRNCQFCAVAHEPGTRHLSIDTFEPEKIAKAVKALGINFAVITSVTRDDLEDGGASQFARTIGSIRAINKNIKIEVLIPDFQGKKGSLRCVVEALPEALGHNIEMPRRLYKELRPGANYEISLSVLSQAKELNPDITTKSSLMLGLGETIEEVIGAMQDLRKHYCDILILGQYLAPSERHFPVQEFLSIAQFKEYESLARKLGFQAVSSGPLVRSSYKAEAVYAECLNKRLTYA